MEPQKPSTSNESRGTKGSWNCQLKGSNIKQKNTKTTRSTWLISPMILWQNFLFKFFLSAKNQGTLRSLALEGLPCQHGWSPEKKKRFGKRTDPSCGEPHQSGIFLTRGHMTFSAPTRAWGWAEEFRGRRRQRRRRGRRRGRGGSGGSGAGGGWSTWQEKSEIMGVSDDF